ncbi:hypothetical protein [Streptomyces sp. NPDC087525]|uniref:hypothetical protein n=1 Tax=Streptomyces sp. NPDC087525 TaxID=3365793 RepID=UPI00382C4B47
MTPDTVLALYRWESGRCFRCALTDVYTARLDEIETPGGDIYELRACGACILDLEEERRRYAQNRGLAYEPGTIGL